MKVLIIGAGSQLRLAATSEALQRGHEVTAAVRTPEKYTDLHNDGVRVVAGDITDSASILKLAEGQDAIVSAAVEYNPGKDSNAFFTSSVHALLRVARGSKPGPYSRRWQYGDLARCEWEQIGRRPYLPQRKSFPSWIATLWV